MRSSRKFSDSENESRSSSRSRRGRKRKRSHSRDRRRRKRRRSRSRSRRRRTRRQRSRDRTKKNESSKKRETTPEKIPPPPKEEKDSPEKTEVKIATKIVVKEEKGSPQAEAKAEVEIVVKAEAVEKVDDDEKKEETENDKKDTKEKEKASPKKSSEEKWKVVKKEKKRSRTPKKEKRRSRSHSRGRRRRRSDRGRRRRTRSRSRGRDRGRRRRSRSRGRGRSDRDRDKKRRKEKSSERDKKKKESSDKKPSTEKKPSTTEKKQHDWAELERSGRTRETDGKYSRSKDKKEGKDEKKSKTEIKDIKIEIKKKGRTVKEEPVKKEKRIEDDPPPKPLTEAEKQQQKKQIRLMVWKAKQQALKQDKKVVEAFENERKRLQDEAKLVKEKREAEQKKQFEETEKLWAEKKKKLELEMEQKRQKRLEERSRKIAKANVARTINRVKSQKKIGFSFGKKPVAKPIKMGVPAGPPGLNSASPKPEPIPPAKKVIEENITTESNNNEKEDKSSSTLLEKQTIMAPPAPTPSISVESTDESAMELQLQQELQAKLDPANHPKSESNDDISTETPSLVEGMEVEGSEQKQDAVAPSEVNEPMEVVEEEIDPLDAFMNQLDDVRRVDDLKQKQKKNSEVIYNDDTVYEEEDLLIEDNTPIRKDWGSKKKELKPIDHLSQDYEPYQKDFYIEAQEIKKMTEEEVKKFQDEYMKGVKIHGQNCPRPIKKWTQCGLPEKVMRALAKAEYSQPFPVQCQTIPAIMSGRDVIGCARTGSGKTCAFVLPMIRHIKMQRPLESGEGPVGMIISPTRELCQQIYYETKKFSKSCGLRVAAIFGGAPVSEQIAMLKRGAEVIVCTPGRMIDMLCTNQGRVVNMKRVTYLVLDEADRMFDLGFEPQIMSIIRQCRPDRQICMFSATFPRAIENLARQILDTPLEIIVGGRSIASEDVNQFVELHDEDSKFNRLLQLLGKWYGRGCILIFHDQQESVDNLFQQLQRVGYLAGIMHGGVDQFDRENAINDFKSGVKTIMIATSVCSRGLDVKDLKVVINYSAPHHYEDYVHRIGRTGRAGTKGWSYTFIDREKEAKFTPDIVKAIKKAKMEENIPEEVVELAKQFKDKVRSGEEVDYNRRGFGGKGYEFNEKEAKKFEQEKMKRRAVLVPDQMTDAVVSQFDMSKRQKKEAEEELTEMDEKKGAGDKVSLQIDLIKKVFEKAKKSGSKVSKKGLIAAEHIAKRKEKKFQKDYAKAVAKKIYSGLQEQKYQDEDKFTFRLDLHEYPEVVRRKMCSKNILDQTRSFFGDRVEILKRGVFLAAGKKLESGADPLHLLIQGDNEVDVVRVRSELNRLLGEALSHMQSKGFHGHGRYSVV